MKKQKLSERLNGADEIIKPLKNHKMKRRSSSPKCFPIMNEKQRACNQHKPANPNRALLHVIGPFAGI